ncbi:MAG: hypothetical protein LBS69_00145 [Prevotellaceae bacterium]|jgi:hypothetical protein|nr:hypothetical protein [Prevotellaceae bacterium]
MGRKHIEIKTTVLIFSMIFLISCATTKKSSITADINKSATIVTDESTVSNINTLIDTTKFTSAEISYTKVEFYAPVADSSYPPTENENVPEDTVFYSKKPPDFGAVKSVETLNIKYSNGQKGTTQSSISVVDSTQTQVDFRDFIKVSETSEQKAKYWLKYIMWIAICATITAAIIYGYKIFNKIKK